MVPIPMAQMDRSKAETPGSYFGTAWQRKDARASPNIMKVIGCVAGPSRKRERGDTPAEQAPLEEVRLPASTMFYISLPKEESLPEGSVELRQLFALSLDLMDMSGSAGHRIWQLRSPQSLRVLQAPRMAAVSEEKREALLRQADGRSLDGVLLDSRTVVLLRQEDLRVIDDDKRAGLSQELLTDMFTRMSLR